MTWLSHRDGYSPAPGCGCGSDLCKVDWVPDSILGISIKKSCCIHDDRYFYGKTIEDKNLADREFLNNMIRLIDAKSGQFKPVRKVRYWLANRYYNAVVKFGGPSFWA